MAVCSEPPPPLTLPESKISELTNDANHDSPKLEKRTRMHHIERHKSYVVTLSEIELNDLTPRRQPQILEVTKSPEEGSQCSAHEETPTDNNASHRHAIADAASEALKRSTVYFRGHPIGTVAADKSRGAALNYDQVFVRDFIPSALAFLMKGEHLIVKNFLVETARLQSREKMVDLFKLGQGVMPASFKVQRHNPTQKTESLLADFGETAIGRVAPVDSGLWWIILLRAYTKWTGDNSLAESPNCQRAMHLILRLCLSEGCDTSPALLCADGCSMIDRRTGIYGDAIEIQALFVMALRCALSLLKQDSDDDFLYHITKRINALNYHLHSYYWLDFQRLNDIYRYKTEEYSQTYSYYCLAAKTTQEPFPLLALSPYCGKGVIHNENTHSIKGEELDTIRNTVTFRLDGDKSTVWTNYMQIMAHLRLWFCSKGTAINISPMVGCEKVIHMVPDHGTFHLVLAYGDSSIDLIIDAREAWLHGGAGPNAIYQFISGCYRRPYITHEYAITLGIEGTYRSVAPEGGVGHIAIGHDPLLNAFSVLEKIDENCSSPDIQASLAIMILHFCEALKFHKVYDIVCQSLKSGRATTLHNEDADVVPTLKKWGKVGGDVGKYVFQFLCNEAPNPLDLSNRKLQGIRTIDDVLENIFIMPRAFLPTRYLGPQSSTHKTIWSPVDAGKGDPKVVPLQNLYNKVLSQSREGNWIDSKFLDDRRKYFGDRTGVQSGDEAIKFLNTRNTNAWRVNKFFEDRNWRGNKFLEDRKTYFGDRTGGQPCGQAIKFLNARATDTSSIWKSTLPVQGRPLPQSVRIAAKFLRFFK